MPTIETLNVKVDTSELKQATADLEAFTAAAQKARDALAELGAISKKVQKPITINITAGETIRATARQLGQEVRRAVS